MERKGRAAKGTFTHFMSIPFISAASRALLRQYQDLVTDCFKQQDRKALNPNNPDLFHITISMLSLNEQTKQKAKAVYQRVAPQVQQVMKDVDLAFSDLRFFQRGKGPYEGINVLFLDLVEDEAYGKVLKCADLLVREFVKDEIIFPEEFRQMHMTYDHNTGMYKPGKLHLTMFYIKEEFGKNVDFKPAIEAARKINFTQRLPAEFVDISTRFSYDLTKYYTPLERIVVPQKERPANKEL